MRSGRGAALVAALAASLSACYAYVPAEIDALGDGPEVRIFLSREAAIRLSDQGASDLISLDDPVVSGSLLHRGDGRLALRVPLRTGSADSPGRPIVQELLLERRDVLRLDRRRLDPTRTALAVAGAAGAATATIVLIVGGSEGDADHPNPPGTSDVRLPSGGASVR